MLYNRDTNPDKPARDLAVAAIALLAKTWPACFVVYERRRRPLKLGIHHDILAALDGAITPQELSRALRRYAGNGGYLRSMVAGAARIGLDGSPAGPAVSAEEAASAAMRLASYVAKKRRPPPATASAPAPASVPAPQAPISAPRRIGLADLRQAAQLRKAREAAAA